MPSFRNNLAARLVADTYGLVTSLIAATITARILGPSGRGFYATLVLLSLLFGQLFNAGLGEAAIVQVGRARVGLETAAAATLTAMIPLSVAGGLTFFLTGSVVLDDVTTNETLAIVFGAILVGGNIFTSTMAWLLVSRERIVLLAVVTIMSGTVTTVMLYALVALADLQVSGAVLASLVGCAAILLPLLRALGREGIPFKLAWDRQYLISAARFGATVQLSNLLVQMTGRLDLVLVYRLAGPAHAGRYSVALTVGALVGSIPMAIAFASFPRLPRVSEEEAASLIASLFRTGIAAAISCAALAGAVSPFLLPFAFGSAYSDAIVPSLVLLPAGVLWSGQWMLCRAAAARDRPRALFVSFSSSFGIMIVLDFLLIGPMGITGAAVASLVSSVAGFLVALVFYRQLGGAWRLLVPRSRDAALMMTTLGHMVASARGRGGREAASDAPAPPSSPG